MKYGNWIPLSKALVRELPTNRPFSKVEAAYSVQVDYDNNQPVSVAGYAKRWGWGRKRVLSFLYELGVTINYPENTDVKQNQKGQIGIQIGDRCRSDREQINFIDNKELSSKKNRSGTDKEQIRDRSGNTTIYTNTKTDTETEKRVVNPGFSQSFLQHHWARWKRLKKGGTYRNAEIESIALEELFELSTGNETIAATGLKTAIAAQSQSYQWCFKDLDNRQQPDRNGKAEHDTPPDQHFGAENIRWLEHHAETGHSKTWPRHP
ncbi:MAG: hypothetical protein J7D60_10835 [Prosthecochloris sp.]|nr:hypothetical protein [Prosthecochloris sp.]